MADLIISVERREKLGKGVAGRLRRGGKIPGILYGDGKEPVPLSIDPETIEEILGSSTGANTIFDLELSGTGQRRPVMIHASQRHPVQQSLLHVDFIRINMQRKVHVRVHLRVEGVPNGVKNQGGILEFLHRDVGVECLPADIPRQMTVDVSHLNVGQAVRVSDLPLDPARYRILDDRETVIAVVALPAAEKEAEVAAAAPAEAPAEPEVIKKGKEKEEAEGAEKKPGEARAAAKPEAKPAGKPEAKAGGKPEARPAGKPEGKEKK